MLLMKSYGTISGNCFQEIDHFNHMGSLDFIGFSSSSHNESQTPSYVEYMQVGDDSIL